MVPGILANLDHYFGFVIIGAALVQAVFGWYHHRRFVQDTPTRRRWFTHVHLWLGRILILCGMANCGFGFPLSNVEFRWAVVWWICCAILAAFYLIASVILALKGARAKSIDQSGGMTSATGRGMQSQSVDMYDLYRYYPGYGSPPRQSQNIPVPNQPYWLAGSA